jgi:hypothetical protein
VCILDVNVVQQTRGSIQFGAEVLAGTNRVGITFDYLDEGDGGAIEILYQEDNSNESTPKLTGSIRGLPEGPRRPSLEGIEWDDDDSDEDGNAQDGNENENSQRAWLAPSGFVLLLVLLSGVSCWMIGLTHPITIVLLTVTGEVILLATIFETLGLYFWQKFRSVKLPKFPDRET